MKLDKAYWNERYSNGLTGWDIGYPSPALVEFVEHLGSKDLKILFPGSGNSYEAEYLFKKGYKNIYILDVVEDVLKNFGERVSDFPKNQLICSDFFQLDDSYDLILEQTFFCALPKEKRRDYCSKMIHLLKPNGKIAGVLFSEEFQTPGPPFGGTKEEYEKLFAQYFKIKTLEPCYNSISARSGRELFFIFETK